MKKLINVMNLAKEKQIILGDLDSMWFKTNARDGIYDMHETTWRYEYANFDNQMSDLYTKKYPQTVVIKDGMIDLESALEAIDSKKTETHSDPHNYFEGFAVIDSVVHINFGS